MIGVRARDAAPVMHLRFADFLLYVLRFCPASPLAAAVLMAILFARRLSVVIWKLCGSSLVLGRSQHS